jgi:hypothetical protein
MFHDAMPLSVCLSVALRPLFSVSSSFTQSVGLLGRGMSQSQGRYQHTTAQTENKRTQTSMTQAEFEPTIPVFEQAKIVTTVTPGAKSLRFTLIKATKAAPYIISEL